MAKKNLPLWQMENLPEPPIVNGYWDYGTVFSIYAHRPRFHYWRELGRQTYWALWSYYYWGRKVRKGFRELIGELLRPARRRQTSPERVEEPRAAA